MTLGLASFLQPPGDDDTAAPQPFGDDDDGDYRHGTMLPTVDSYRADYSAHFVLARRHAAYGQR